jgi:hypothetical protein
VQQYRDSYGKYAANIAKQQDEIVERLRGLLLKASGPMSYGRWSTDFRREVEKALAMSTTQGEGQIATPHPGGAHEDL